MSQEVAAGSGLLQISHGYWSEPFRGIPPCGDAAAMVIGAQGSWLLVLDAIGHGVSAARIARRLLAMFQQSVQASPSDALPPTPGTPAALTPIALVEQLHRQLTVDSQDNQAAVGLFRFSPCNSQLDAVLVGNLDARVLRPEGCSRLSSQNGMLGGRLPRLQSQRLPLQHDSVLAVFSDGMRIREAAAVLPHHVYRDRGGRSLSLLARTLVDGYRRDYDDSSCALVRVQRQAHG